MKEKEESKFKKWIKKWGIFGAFWVSIHGFVIIFMIVIAIVWAVLCSFGWGPGLNPPLDIHIPTSEEIYQEYERERQQEERDNGTRIEIENEDGSKDEVTLG